MFGFAFFGTRATTIAGTLAAVLAAAPAEADIVNTSDCQRDLAMANRRITAIAAREKQFVKDDLTRNCGLLRQNLVDLVKARDPMDRCMTGHDHGENIGQMDDSIEDVRAGLADKCGK